MYSSDVFLEPPLVAQVDLVEVAPIENVENKYGYAVFAGFKGERYLKSILVKILPMALYRTWEVLVDHQAPGNECFLSVHSLTAILVRHERTIRENLAELCGRGLLNYQAISKTFVLADGSTRSRMVVHKDFSRLYHLAYEYHLWVQEGNDYVPCEREYADVIRATPELLAKVRRFEHYRRLLYNQSPGPKRSEREIYLWYREYDPMAEPQSCPPPFQGDVERALDTDMRNTRDTRRKHLIKDLKKDLKKESLERKETSDYSKQLHRDSFESEAPLGERGGGQDYTKRPKVSTLPTAREEEIANAPTNPANTNAPSISVGKAGRAAARRESAESDPAVEMARRAMGAARVTPGQKERAAGKRGGTASGDGKPRPADNPLVRSLLQEIIPLFGDQNPKASRTRALRLVQEYHLEGWELVACLVRAYVVTRDTKQVKRQDPRTGQPLRMPLFLKMLETFAQAWAAGTNWSYLQGDLETDIEADDRLSLWLGEQSFQNGREQADLPPEDAIQEPETPLTGPDTDECASDTSQTQEGWEAEEDSGQEEREETSQEDLSVPVLTVEHEEDGFRTWEDANKYGEWLREECGEMEYGHQVWTTQYGRWVILLYAHTAPLAETEVFLNRETVRERLAELRQAKRERQRERMASRPVGRAKRR